MIKCPFCGSDKLAMHTEKKGSHLISKGLPAYFLDRDWFYYVCNDCFEIAKHGNYKLDFIFTVVSGKYYLYIGEKGAWLPKGMPREVVEFT